MPLMNAELNRGVGCIELSVDKAWQWPPFKFSLKKGQTLSFHKSSFQCSRLNFSNERHSLEIRRLKRGSIIISKSNYIRIYDQLCDSPPLAPLWALGTTHTAGAGRDHWCELPTKSYNLSTSPANSLLLQAEKITISFPDFCFPCSSNYWVSS